MRSCQTYWRNPPKARSVTVHSFAGIRSETMLNAPRNTLECAIKASRGFQSDLTAKGAGFNSWRGENWAQGGKKRLILIIWNLPAPFSFGVFFFFCFFFLFLTGTVQMRIVRMKDVRALGPIGLDYGITGLIIGQSSGKSRSRAIDALEWRKHKRLDRSNSSISRFYSTLWHGQAVYATRAEPICNSVPHRKKSKCIVNGNIGQCCILNGHVSICCSLGVDVAWGQCAFVSYGLTFTTEIQTL